MPGKGTNPGWRGDPSARLGQNPLDIGVEGQMRKGRRESYDTNMLGKGAQNPSRLPSMSVVTTVPEDDGGGPGEGGDPARLPQPGPGLLPGARGSLSVRPGGARRLWEERPGSFADSLMAASSARVRRPVGTVAERFFSNAFLMQLERLAFVSKRSHIGAVKGERKSPRRGLERRVRGLPAVRGR